MPLLLNGQVPSSFLKHFQLVSRYGVAGCRFRVYHIGAQGYLHVCRYFQFVSELPF
jgi:hypothetical protein